MGRTTTIGIVFIVTGALIAATSSGAFDATLADRGAEVKTASDETALLGLDYPSQEQRAIKLQSTDASFCIGGCWHFDRIFATLQDNTLAGGLTIQGDVGFLSLATQKSLGTVHALTTNPVPVSPIFGDAFGVPIPAFSILDRKGPVQR